LPRSIGGFRIQFGLFGKIAMTASIFLLFVALVAVAAIAGRIDRSPVSATTRVAISTAPAKVERAVVHEREHVLVEDLGKQYCIGGSMCPDYCEQPGKGCEAQSSYSLKLDRPASISRIALHAQDQIVLNRQAELVVKVDGRQLGKFPVRSNGAIRIPVNRTGQRITIESRDPNDVRKSGEEAVISEIHVFGRELRRYRGAVRSRQISHAVDGLRERPQGRRAFVQIAVLRAECSRGGATKAARSATQPGPARSAPVGRSISARRFAHRCGRGGESRVGSRRCYCRRIGTRWCAFGAEIAAQQAQPHSSINAGRLNSGGQCAEIAVKGLRFLVAFTGKIA